MRIGVMGTGIVGPTIGGGTEMLLPIWLRLWAALGTADINFHIAGAPARPG